MKAMAKMTVCTIGLSLVITGCAHLRPPETDPAVVEQREKAEELQLEKEQNIPGNQLLADIVSAGWSQLAAVRRW